MCVHACACAHNKGLYRVRLAFDRTISRRRRLRFERKLLYTKKQRVYDPRPVSSITRRGFVRIPVCVFAMNTRRSKHYAKKLITKKVGIGLCWCAPDALQGGRTARRRHVCRRIQQCLWEVVIILLGSRWALFRCCHVATCTSQETILSHVQP